MTLLSPAILVRLAGNAPWAASLHYRDFRLFHVNDISQVYEDPQVIAREMKVDLEDPDLGTLHNIGIPVKLSATPGRIRRRAPMLGEHSWEILTESGFAKKEIEELFDSGIVVDGRS